MTAPHGSMTAFNNMRDSYLAHLTLADAAARAAVLRERWPFKPAQVEPFNAGPVDIRVFTDMLERCLKLVTTIIWLGGGGGCGLGRGVVGLGGPRAGVDGLCRLCCGVAVGGPFAGGRPSVFQRSPSLLVRWGDAWVRWRAGGGVGVLRTGPVAAGVRVYSSVSHL
jgi:hypothetical protein